MAQAAGVTGPGRVIRALERLGAWWCRLRHGHAYIIERVDGIARLVCVHCGHVGGAGWRL